jgi:hypothetical protein
MNTQRLVRGGFARHQVAALRIARVQLPISGFAGLSNHT